MLPPSIDHILSMQFAPHFYVEDKGMEVDFGYWAHTCDEPDEEPPKEIFCAFLFFGKIRAGVPGWVEEWWNLDAEEDEDDCECNCARCVSAQGVCQAKSSLDTQV